MKSYFLFALSAFVAAIQLSYAACDLSKPARTPNSRFTLLGAEVKDNQTGLIWQRCRVGETWNGVICSGTETLHSFETALTKAKQAGNGWRLPSIKELHSIVETQCSSPALNTNIFPLGATQSTDLTFWSNTQHRQNSNEIWVVGFNLGVTGSIYMYWDASARLVRTAP